MKGAVMRKLVVAAIIVCMASPVFAANPVKTPKQKQKAKVLRLKTEEQKTLYAVGLVLARQLESFNLTPSELRLVQHGLTDGVRGRKARVDFITYSKKSQEMGIARRDARGKKLEEMAPEFIEKAAAEEGAVKTRSGAVYLMLKEGEGVPPTENEIVRLHFVSALIDKREMDSTYKRGEPEEDQLNHYIKCLTEGVQLMKPGGRAKLVCPPETALGKKSFGLVPPNATLVYEVELLEVKPQLVVE